MAEENKVKNLDWKIYREQKKNLIEKVKQNELISKKHKRVCKT